MFVKENSQCAHNSHVSAVYCSVCVFEKQNACQISEKRQRGIFEKQNTGQTSEKRQQGDIWPEKPRHKRLPRTLPCRRCWTVGLRSVLAAIGLAFSMENIVVLDLYFWNWFKLLALNNWIVNYRPCFLDGKIVWLLRFEADLNPELLTKEKLISSQLWCVSRVWDQDYQLWSSNENILARWWDI